MWIGTGIHVYPITLDGSSLGPCALMASSVSGAHYYNFRTLGENPAGYAILGYSAVTSEWLIAWSTLTGLTGALALEYFSLSWPC